jgi:predicted metalloprotease
MLPLVPARLLALLVVAFALVALSGCGSEDVDRAREDAERRVEDVRRDVEERIDRAEREFEERRERYGKRIEEVLQDLEKVFERPAETNPNVRSRGRNEPTTIDAFLTDILQNVDRYWTRTFATADLPEPSVRYVWVAPGARVLTGCGQPADDRAAFYCPADDTIYVAQRFAAALYEGVGRLRPRGRRLRGRVRPRARVRAQPPAGARRLRQHTGRERQALRAAG